LKDHKNKLVKARDEEAQPEEVLTEVLLSLRVNALQIPPEQRRDFVAQLIKNDIFNIKTTQSMEFLQYMLGLNNHSLIHSLSALISVVVSTSEGVEYMTHSKGNIIDL